MFRPWLLPVRTLRSLRFFSFAQTRFSLWDSKVVAVPSLGAPLTVTLPDGKLLETQQGQLPLVLAEKISKSLAKETVAALVEGQPWDLKRPLEQDCSLQFVRWEDPAGRSVYWHSSAHVLGAALERYFGDDLLLCDGPALERNGFFYEFQLKSGAAVKESDFPQIEKLMNEISSKRYPFERRVVSRAEAQQYFAENRFKLEIIEALPSDAVITLYRCGEFVDLCRGPHLRDTKLGALKIRHSGSAYWQGDAGQASLQRIYAISFPKQSLLLEWEAEMKLAAERDHRNIGKKQALFFFHPFSPGSAFFLPHGTRIMNRLEEFLRAEYRRRGYEEVRTPLVFNKELWETSGHWQHYKDNMFLLAEEDMALKPMNCPGHCLVFKNTTRSYRELPIRLADFSALHRNEAAGALTGLSRVRRFSQDDAHIFCAESHLEKEIFDCIDFVSYVYRLLGFEFRMLLSTRPTSYIGELAQWDAAEDALKRALK